MALDFFAIASNGYFPTPTPSNAERAALAATWGYYWNVSFGKWYRFINLWGWPWRKTWKKWG